MLVSRRTKTRRYRCLAALLLTHALLVACAHQQHSRDASAHNDLLESGADDDFEWAMDENGLVQLPAMTIPQSTALSDESQAAQRLYKVYWSEWHQLRNKHCPNKILTAAKEDLPAIRKCRAETFKKTRWYRDVMARYKVDIEERVIGGIITDLYTPQAGIAKKNRHRVLIHLHGGSHYFANRWGGYTGASPIAATAEIKVISVDYRQWPEAPHPAAMEDVAAVYETLLKSYRPENIGIYGCSAGGYWSAQTIPWFQKAGLPRPGAVGIFGVGIGSKGSDSVFAGVAYAGLPVPTPAQMRYTAENPRLYFKGVSINEPILYPGDFPDVLAQYPPTLFVNSSRDFSLSTAAHNHAQMVKQGVDANFHMWEGLNHCFIYNPELPEAHDANAVITRFFDKHLGKLSKY